MTEILKKTPSRIGIMPRSAALSVQPGDELKGLSPSGRLRSPGQVNPVLALELSGAAGIGLLTLTSCGPAVINHLEKQGIPSENISQIYSFPNTDGVEANNPQDVTSQINFLTYSDNTNDPHMVFLTEDSQDISYDRKTFLYYIGTPDRITSVNIVTANDEEPRLNWQDDPNQFSVAFQMDLKNPLSRVELDNKINDQNISIDTFASRVLLSNPGTDESIKISFPLPDSVNTENRTSINRHLRVLLVGDQQNGLSPTMSPEIITTLTPSAPTPSPTLTETPPATAKPTATQTEIPTPTEAPRMTLEDWKEVFTGPFIDDRGGTHELGLMFREDFNTILTDPNQVKMLPVGSPITILNPDGSVIIFADPDVAAERVEKGAIVLNWQRGPTPDNMARYALTAAALQYQKGNKNIYVQFNENSVGEFPFNGRYGTSIFLNNRVLQMTLDDGTIITPIMAMPKHFEVSHAYVDEKPLTLEQAGIIITNPDNWLDQVLKAGYDMIVVYPWDK